MSTIGITRGEKTVSGALALGMHLLFALLLLFGVTWQQKRSVAPVTVELWSNLPSQPQPKVEPAPPEVKPEPEPPPPPKAVEPKAEPKPAPKVEPKPEPKPEPKADIELREKLEKERKAREQALAEKKKRQEQELAEKKKRLEQERVAELKKKQAAEAEAKRREQEQAEAHRKAAQAQAAAQGREIDKYRQAIAAKIKRFIVEPPNVQGNPVAELGITTLPGGEVLDVRTRKSSGQAAWDNACERAIRRAQPLPLPPPDSPIYREFRELTHACRYKE